MIDIGSTSLEKGATQAHIEKMRNCKEAMSRIFDDFATQMRNAGGSDVFWGEASESFQDRFNSLKPKFDEFCALVEKFAANFEGAVKETEETDKQMASQAEQMHG